MSHTNSIKLEIKDKNAIKLACERLNLRTEEGEFKLYSSTEKGIGVYLNGWKYPIVIKEDGTVAYDNYNGKWGCLNEMNKFKAYYGVEKAKIEARKKGYSVYETFNDVSKTIELKIKVG